LATEAEWEHAAQLSQDDFFGSNGFSNNRFYEPQGCGPIDHSQTPRLRQMAGHVWEWTSSAYSAYPGFKPFAGNAGEYNGKFMANQFILRGGSCATPPGHARATYRNFFYPPDRWQYSGIRLAKDAV
jgi:formylglycine-generating enzyme required for sulfatase activity